MKTTTTSTSLKEAKAAWKLAQDEHNEANNHEGKWKWNNKRITEGFFYGQFEMQQRLEKRVEEINEYYMDGTGYHVEATEHVLTQWDRKDDYGFASMKVQLLKNS